MHCSRRVSIRARCERCGRLLPGYAYCKRLNDVQAACAGLCADAAAAAEQAAAEAEAAARAAQVRHSEAAAEHQGSQARLQARCGGPSPSFMFMVCKTCCLYSFQAGSAGTYPACSSLQTMLEMFTPAVMCMCMISTC